MTEISKIRIDKWLWTIRIFKSRSLATKVCKAGKVKINDKVVKPSYLVSRGERIQVNKNGYNLDFEVLDILKSRVSATLAVDCYTNHTPQEELDKYKSWFIGKGAAEKREKGAGRPTKKERRSIEEFKEDQWWEYLDDE